MSDIEEPMDASDALDDASNASDEEANVSDASDASEKVDSQATVSETHSDMLYRMRALDMSDDESEVHDDDVPDADEDPNESVVDEEETDTEDSDASYSGSSSEEEEEEPEGGSSSRHPSRDLLDLEIDADQFQSMIKEILGPDMAFDEKAMLALQVAAEDYCYDMFGAANGIAKTAGRVTVYPEDMALVKKMAASEEEWTRGEKELLFAKKPFERLAKEVLEGEGLEYGLSRFSVEAYEALQTAAEAFLEEQFVGMAMMTRHRKRQVSTLDDMQLEQWVKKKFKW